MSTRLAEQSPVKVSVTTVIDDGQQKETFELTTVGRYFKKGRNAYLQYDEALEEGTVHTTVKLMDREVLILRSGALQMRLHFLQGKMTPSNYKSPYGLLQAEVDTKQIMMNRMDNHALINIVYDFTMQGTHAGTYHMNIEYEEERE